MMITSPLFGVSKTLGDLVELRKRLQWPSNLHAIAALLVVFLCCSSFSNVKGQSYLGWSTKSVNLREGPGTDQRVLMQAHAGDELFIISTVSTNDFYPVILIRTNTEGYVHRSFVKVGQVVESNEQGIFAPTGRSSGEDPELEIYNNTELTLTLKLNASNYSFKSQERRTLTLTPGLYAYRASAPNVIPDFGSESIKRETNYTWQFYIVTR